MSVALRKIEGVDSVTVSLDQGRADIELKPGNTVDPEVIRKAVRDNGFTPKTADVKVDGRITERDGRVVLSVTGPEIVYVLVDHPGAKSRLDELEKPAMGAEVTLTGRLPEKAEKRAPGEPRKLEVYELHRASR